MGEKFFRNIPKQVAKFLGKDDWNLYTGHSLRRTSATFLANLGLPIDDLKRFGLWLSNTACEGYIDQSTHQKRKFALAMASCLGGVPDNTAGDRCSLTQDFNLNVEVPSKKAKCSPQPVNQLVPATVCASKM